jgi:hypothetical protein
MSYNPNDIEQRYCGACHKFHENPDAYMLGTTDHTTTPEEMHVMAIACRELLTPEELALVVRAIDTCEDIFVKEMMRHGGRTITPPVWAALVLSCARLSLVIQEIENVIRTHYARERHDEIRHVMLEKRDPDLFEMMTTAIGSLDVSEWQQLVLRCVASALELDDQKETIR